MAKPQPIDLESGMLSTKEAARLLGKDASTLRNWRSERTGPPYVKFGPRSVSYPRAGLFAYAAERLRTPMHAG